MSGFDFAPHAGQLALAYREVVAELVGDEALRQRCAAVQALVVQRMGNAREAGKALLMALNGCRWWDWPAWDAFAQAQGRDTLAAIDQRYARISLTDVCAKASKDELGRALDTLGIAFKRAQTKAALAALLESAGQAKALGALAGVVQRLRDRDVRECQEQMALFMVVRMLNKAHKAERYAQLLETDFMAHDGRWRFVCGELEPCHSPLKHMCGQLLPAAQARLAFPRLPCEWLTCSGRIRAER